MLITILILIITIALGLTFLVVIHELGHFLVAKKFNIKVLEFGFGIPPRIFGKKVGETIVSLNALPIGGFVRLWGEEEVDKKAREDKRSFAAQRVEKRIAVVIAGIVMNLLTAWVIFTIYLGLQGFKTDIPLLFPHRFVGVTQITKQQILIAPDPKDPNSPASLAGIKDVVAVVALDNQPITSVNQFVQETDANKGEPITLILSDINSGKQTQVTLTPRKNPQPHQGAIGVGVSENDTATLIYATPLQKVFSGVIHSYNIAGYTVQTLGELIGQSFKEKSAAPISYGAGGPIALGYIVYQLFKTGSSILPFLNLLAYVSLTLALVNVFPFPALDGGRLFFLLVEFVSRKRINPELENKIHAVGMAILLGLMVLVTYSDVNHFILNR